jgi:malate dehydrogenase (oxaloacetate-decarboxylating)
MAATPSAQYSLTLRVEIDHLPGMLGKVASAIGAAGATIGAVDLVAVDGSHTIRDITVETGDSADWPRLTAAVESVAGARVLDATDRTFMMHLGGKIEVVNKHPLKTRDDLSMAYTPGVARVCSAIAAEPDKAFQYTIKRNTVAVVSDGTAVLGLGDIGPRAAMPVMEGKAMLFKEFAGVDAFPICLDTRDPDEIVAAVKAIAPGFGGINLEDISAPRCFEIEDRLRALLDIPVMHDDQHGTAIVALAALRSAARVVGKELSSMRVVVAGAGASGIAVSKIILAAGIGEIAAADSKGMIYHGRDGLNPVKTELAKVTNASGFAGAPEAALRGADAFIGLSGCTLPEDALARMAPGAIAFLLSNPNPEVDPEIARKHAAVVATGRSDFPNQINNSLAFPGVFRAALDVRATTITENMKLAAADALAALVGDDARPDYVIPSQFDERVAPAVAAAVAAQARADGVARR